MPLIQKQKREVKRPITIKLEQNLADRLNWYAAFPESSRDRVVSGILQYVMDRDKDFAAYVTANEPGSSQGDKTPSATTAKAGS